MRLYVEPMDAVVVDMSPDGLVQLASREWFQPSMQERRAILYAAEKELEALRELVDTLDPK